MSSARRASPGSTVRVEARLTLRFTDPEQADRAHAALSPESEGFLTLDRKEDLLEILVPEGRVGRVLATVDDTLSCLQAAQAAEAAAKNKSGSGS